MPHAFALHPDAQARMNMLRQFLQSRQTANDAKRESLLIVPNGLEEAEARRTECVGRESRDLSTIVAPAEAEMLLTAPGQRGWIE